MQHSKGDNFMIEIDGAYGEGSGQIIRTALSLSAITKKSIRIYNIRANRPNPGLSAQHLTAVKAVRSICRGTLSNCEIKSMEFTFEPGEIYGGKYKFNIGTAGSVILVAQTILPILIFASKPSIIRIIGGTHVMKSPCYDYFEKVFLPAINMFGVDAHSHLFRSGYYPKGGGEIEFNVKPNALYGNQTWPKEEHTKVIIRISDLPVSVAIREKKIFVQNKIDDIHIYEEHSGPANAILAWNGFLGSYVLGEKTKRAESVAQECLENLLKERNVNSEVDSNLADQLLIYASLARGETRFKTSEITTHTKTNAYIISEITNRKITFKNSEIEVK